jgi:hypothetical protein
MILIRLKGFLSYLRLMKKILLLLLAALACRLFSYAQYCDGVGNVLLFANYDGGNLTINIDQNIPNIKIGVCSYEAVQIEVVGPFANNVTEVRYAGFNSNNNNCVTSISQTTISTPNSAPSSILVAPPATISDPDGYPSIICAYSCESGEQGGCNTAEQIIDYFMSQFGGDLRFLYAQYNCWPASAIGMNPSGGCCGSVITNPPVASFDMSAVQLCTGECIDLLDLSTNSPSAWLWSFPGAVTTSSALQDPTGICYNFPGTFEITLTSSNAGGSSSAEMTIVVESCDIPGCTYPQALNYNPNATVDNQSCTFDCNNDCPGDFDNNGIVGVSDLLIFIALYGTLCE